MPNRKALCTIAFSAALQLCACSSDEDLGKQQPQSATPQGGSGKGNAIAGAAATQPDRSQTAAAANGGSGESAARSAAAGGTGSPAAAAAGGAGSPAMNSQPVAGTAGMNSSAAGSTSGAPPVAGSALMGMCPDGFTPKAGMNVAFPSGGKMRTFHVSAPTDSDGPAPLFVALTGTVQEELSFAMQAGLSTLPAQGWLVVSPVRSCSQEARNCSATGMDGRVWEPWFDGTAPRSDEAGPDVDFVEAMVRCVASTWPVAADKIYAGGISAGGSFTNRNMTFNSKLFAGGIPASGNWSYGVPPATAMQMDPSIVIIIWGGPNDTWPGSPPYAEETKAAADYYAAQPDVVTVACSGTHGHAWPSAATPWLIETLLSHPKGSAKSKFTLKPPQGGLTCVLGAYTDH